MSSEQQDEKTETRNIIDHYWYWDTEAIKADLDTRRHKFGVLTTNFGNDFNIASVIRNANAFMAEMVYIYGRRKWDKRGAVGTHNYLHIKHLPDDFDLGGLEDYYTLVGIDNIPGAVPIDDFEWPERTLMCFGQEQIGLPQNVINRCKSVVYIKQYGSVRSLNVACASAIAMQDYCRKVVGGCNSLSEKE
jgi:tRNA G18 (ribose-2'-O)-methylase SpoU